MRKRPLVTPQRSALLAARAHVMRATATASERVLWERLRAKQLGCEFRRQLVIGDRYIGDFVARSAKLVVEVDGASHRQRAAADARRDRALRRLGYRVLRLEPEIVMRDIEQAVALVRAALAEE